MSDNAADACPFCEKFGSHNPHSTSLKWFDFPIHETEDFVAVPALGQITPGYLLIIPREHIFSMAQMNPEKRLRLYDFIAVIKTKLSVYSDKQIIFEHGTCTHAMMSGACINHAHWHIVPGEWQILPQNLEFTTYVSFEDFASNRPQNIPYLLYANQDTCFVAEGVKVPSQYFRRQLATANGTPDSWDYLAFPFFENIKYTLSQLT